MVAAAAADVQACLKIAVEQHLPAIRAFVPEIVGHVLLGDNGANLGENEIGEPVHRPCKAPIAPRARRETAHAPPPAPRQPAPAAPCRWRRDALPGGRPAPCR